MASVRSLNCLLLLFGVCGLLTSFASGDTVTVGIVLVQHVSYGQSFKLVGNTAELGNWDTSKGITMTYTQGDVWTASVELNRGESYEYKAVVVDSSSDTCACWMPGGNRVLKIPSDAKSVYFVSTFWDTNTCASTCSTTNACSFDNVGSCSSINIRKKNHKADSVTVAFVMTQHLSFGQGFRLVGNTADLGNWQPSNGLQMTWGFTCIVLKAVSLSVIKDGKHSESQLPAASVKCLWPPYFLRIGRHGDSWDSVGAARELWAVIQTGWKRS